MQGKDDGYYDSPTSRDETSDGKKRPKKPIKKKERLKKPIKKLREKERRDNVTILFHTCASK